MKKKKRTGPQLVETALRKHFARYRLHDLVSASRMFPTSARVDLQSALEKLLPVRLETRQFGVHRQYDHSTLTFANLMGNVHDPRHHCPNAVRGDRHRRDVACALSTPGPLAIANEGHTVCPAIEPGGALWTDKRSAFGNRGTPRRRRCRPLPRSAKGS